MISLIISIKIPDYVDNTDAIEMKSSVKEFEISSK